MNYFQVPAAAQREIILVALQHFDGNKGLTADALGTSRKTWYDRPKGY